MTNQLSHRLLIGKISILHRISNFIYILWLHICILLYLIKQTFLKVIHLFSSLHVLFNIVYARRYNPCYWVYRSFKSAARSSISSRFVLLISCSTTFLGFSSSKRIWYMPFVIGISTSCSSAN